MLFHGNRSRVISSIAIALLACCLGGVTARADLPRPPRPTPAPNPPPAKADDQQLVVSTDPDAKEAHLRIPRSALKGAAPAGAPRVDNGLSPVRTVVAGIALTAAITISGLMLARGRGRRGRLLLLAGLIGSAGVIASIATANVPPPPRPPKPAPIQVVIPAGGFKVPVVIEIVDDGPVQLSLPPSEGAVKP